MLPTTLVVQRSEQAQRYICRGLADFSNDTLEPWTVESPLSRTKRFSTSPHSLLAGCLALASTGCSLLLVNEPARAHSGMNGPGSSQCTSSRMAPVVDTIVATGQVVRVIYAANASSNAYEGEGQPLSRGADITYGVGFAALFLGSAIYGYGATAHCLEVRRRPDTASGSFGP